MPWRIVTLFSEFGSTSNVLSFVLSVFSNISENPVNVKYFAGATFSGANSSFPSQPLSSCVLRSLPH